MNSYRWSFLAILVLCWFAFPHSAMSAELEGKVVEVVSGQTIVISFDNRLLTVHLANISAPTNDHPLAEVARQHLANFVLGKVVSIRYSRMQNSVTNGSVFLNGNNIGVQMVRDGAASYDPRSARELSEQNRHLYEESERAARNEERGIWQPNLPPWSLQVQPVNELKSNAGTPSGVLDSAPGRQNRLSPGDLEASYYSSGKSSATNSRRPVLKSVMWAENAPGCDSYYHEGQLYLIIEDEQLKLLVTLYESDGYRMAEALVINISDKRKLVDPSMARFTYTTRDNTTAVLSPLSVEKIAKKTNRRVMWANILSGLAASIPQTTTAYSTTSGSFNMNRSDGVTGHGTYSGTTTTTITAPNRENQRLAAENNRRRSSAAADRIQRIRQASLKMNTIFPGEKVAGTVYFEKKKFQEGLFQILIDDTVYSFRLTGESKK